MNNAMSRRQTQLEGDRLGFDQTRNYTTEILNKLLPRFVAHRSIQVSLETDALRYERGEPVEITLEFKNRLPIPVTVYTETRLLWGWTVDGQLEASDEPRYVDEQPGRFDFRGRERKTYDIVWDGRLKRTGERDIWVVPEPGEYTITGYLGTKNRPQESVVIEIE